MDTTNPNLKYGTGLLACAVFGYYAFIRNTQVPLISFADLGFHELGHFVTYFLPVPDVASAIAGSLNQVLVPWGLAIYFSLFRADMLGGVVCLAWAGSSLQDASVYIADAPYQNLPLLGGGGNHDWAFILGPGEWDMLDKADEIAAVVKGLGLVLILGAMTICVVGLILENRSGHGEAAA